MTTTAEKIAVMQAYEDGKEIEYYNSNGYSKWEKSTKPTWNWYVFDYRVKPEPEYIPFTFEDAEFLIGKTVKYKRTGVLRMITYCNYINTSVCSYEHLLAKYIFPDGSPCGKLKTI